MQSPEVAEPTQAAAVPLPETPAPVEVAEPVVVEPPQIEAEETLNSSQAPDQTEPKVQAKVDGNEEAEPAEDSEMAEPQNDLTRKFTQPEWSVLREFRKHLPEIIAEAYKDSETKPSSFTIWGILIDPATPSARASVILMKFLRARNLSVTDAKSMLIATLRWREQFNVQKCMEEKFDPEIFGKLGFVYGKDKGGRPVTYNLYGANQDLKAVFGDVQRFVRWRVALMERSMKKLDFETVDQMVQVHDYEGVSLSSRDANSKAAASEATSIFQNHYPEFVYKKYFVNVPRLMTWIFWIFRSLVSSQTFAKMSVVGSGPQTIGKELLVIIDAEQLPKRYGGSADAF